MTTVEALGLLAKLLGVLGGDEAVTCDGVHHHLAGDSKAFEELSQGTHQLLLPGALTMNSRGVRTDGRRLPPSTVLATPGRPGSAASNPAA